MRWGRRKKTRRKIPSLDIPTKANWILRIIFACMALVLIRCWHLTHVQYEEKIIEARKPQQRLVVKSAKRGTIRDRFNIPLAINRIQYNIGVVYSEIKQIPTVKWERDQNGKRKRHLKRKEYVSKLALLLGEELDLDAERIEDLIYSKSALYNQVPYILKENITEEKYYRLKMLAKDWLGIHVQSVPKRYYPKGKLAADVIGYMGAINREEYDAILQELRVLRSYQEAEEIGDEAELPEGCHSSRDVRKRLCDLEEHAYRMNDYVGKAGVEGQFEELLRGFQGKKRYFSNAKGALLRELPGTKEPTSGQRILLSISSELQEFAEQLLIQNESIRKVRVIGESNPVEPWIKGGAIVVMEPNTGEILTLASYPRFNPNDFSASGQDEEKKTKQSAVRRWFETERYLGEVWDQKQFLERETYDWKKRAITTEEAILDWNEYLSRILPKRSFVHEALKKIGTIANAVELQHCVTRLFQISQQENLYSIFNHIYHTEDHFKYGSPQPAHLQAQMEENFTEHQQEVKQIKKKLTDWLSPVSHNYDKVLVVDLCRIAIDERRFNQKTLAYTGNTTLDHYRNLSSSMSQVREVIKEIVKEHFHATTFSQWRQEHAQAYLKAIREEEKKQKKYAKPYLDYLDREEKQMFQQFWSRYQSHFLTLFLTGLSIEEGVSDYNDQLRLWINELDQGAHKALPWYRPFRLLKKNLSLLPIDVASSYLQTLRGFHDLNRPLYGYYRYQRKTEGKQLEKHLAMAFYPIYGFGYARSYAYRQGTPPGSIFKLIPSYKALVQRYYQLGQENPSYEALNPLVIIDQPHKKGEQRFVGYHANGKPIPQLYNGGRLMKSVTSNIGKVDLLGALESSSNPYFSIMSAEVLDDPLDLRQGALDFSYGRKTGIELPWEARGKVPDDIDINKTGLYTMANGQHTLLTTPLQTAVMLSSIANGGHLLQPNIIRLSAGYVPDREKTLQGWGENYPYRDSLESVGIDFPLFTKPLGKEKKQHLQYWGTKENYQIFMPDPIRKVLLEGMRKVAMRQGKLGLPSLSNLYKKDPGAISDLLEMQPFIVGKSSTAEKVENLNLDLYSGTGMYNHVWFGGVAFDKKISKQVNNGRIVKGSVGNPELVVVVYLPYGSFGKDALPVAAQVIQKWRAIKNQRDRLVK